MLFYIFFLMIKIFLLLDFEVLYIVCWILGLVSVDFLVVILILLLLILIYNDIIILIL